MTRTSASPAIKPADATSSVIKNENAEVDSHSVSGSRMRKRTRNSHEFIDLDDDYVPLPESNVEHINESVSVARNTAQAKKRSSLSRYDAARRQYKGKMKALNPGDYAAAVSIVHFVAEQWELNETECKDLRKRRMLANKKATASDDQCKEFAKRDAATIAKADELRRQNQELQDKLTRKNAPQVYRLDSELRTERDEHESTRRRLEKKLEAKDNEFVLTEHARQHAENRCVQLTAELERLQQQAKIGMSDQSKDDSRESTASASNDQNLLRIKELEDGMKEKDLEIDRLRLSVKIKQRQIQRLIVDDGTGEASSEIAKETISVDDNQSPEM